MRILRLTKAFLSGLSLKLFPSLGPKGIINTQINMYQRFKKRFPATSENDLLNLLIRSRMNSPLSPSSTQEENTYYKPMLQDSSKTLEDVIFYNSGI